MSAEFAIFVSPLGRIMDLAMQERFGLPNIGRGNGEGLPDGPENNIENWPDDRPSRLPSSSLEGGDGQSPGGAMDKATGTDDADCNNMD